jgi:hypothetical protein
VLGVRSCPSGRYLPTPESGRGSILSNRFGWHAGTLLVAEGHPALPDDDHLRDSSDHKTRPSPRTRTGEPAVPPRLVRPDRPNPLGRRCPRLRGRRGRANGRHPVAPTGWSLGPAHRSGDGLGAISRSGAVGPACIIPDLLGGAGDLARSPSMPGTSIECVETSTPTPVRQTRSAAKRAFRGTRHRRH